MTIDLAVDQWPVDAEPTLRAPALLAHPSLRLCLDLYLETSLPWTLPVDLSQRPLRVSHDEVTIETPGASYGQHYTRRILDVSGLYDEAPDLFGVVPDIPQLTVRLSLRDADDARPWGDLRRLTQQEVRGKLCVAHLYDVASRELEPAVFVGYLSALAYDRHTVQLVLAADEPGRLRDPMALEVARHFPAAPLRDRGALIARGWGIGRYVPLRCTKGRTDETTLVQRTFTADAGTNRATITAHGLGEGDGPFRVSSTGTLPGGLEEGVDYYVAESDDDTFQFGRDPSGEPEVIVDLLDAGTGTHTLSSGVAPQLDDHWDHDVWGTCSVDEVFQSGEKALPSEYSLMRRQNRVLGRYCTTVRFRSDPGPVTAHLQRVHPDAVDGALAWFWDEGDFRASLGDLAFASGTTLGAAGLDSSALVAGPTGVGLGAVALNGTDEYLETAPTAPRPTTFTCALWWWWDGVAGSWVNGPGLPFDSSDYASWQLGATGTGALLASYRVSSSLRVPYLSPDATLWARAWNAAVLVVTPDRVDFYANGALQGSDTLIGLFPLAYSWMPLGLTLGAGIGNGDSYGGGRCGPVWYLPGVAWTARDAALHYYRMRRSPVEAAREAERDAGETIDTTSWDTAAADVDAVVDGALRCDGYVTEPIDLAGLRQRFALFRQFQYGRTGTGQVTLAVAKPATEIVATFGLDDDVARNVVALRGGGPSSLAEAVRTLPVACRPQRDPVTGALGGFQHTITRNVHVVGTTAAPLLAWFVWDTLTGDIIADLRAKLRRSRDELLQLTVAHEGRYVRPGEVVRLRIPDLDIALRDLVALRTVRTVHLMDLDGVAYREADFDYTPKPLPPEPPTPQLTALDLGDATITLVGRQDAAVTVRVDPRATSLCVPDAASSLMQGTLVGGSTHVAVLGDASDATYVASPGTAYVFVGVANPVLPTAIGLRVTVTVRAVRIGPAGILQVGLLLGGVGRYGAIESLTASVAEYSRTWDTSPFTGQAWTLAEINALAAGVAMTSAQLMRVTVTVVSTLDVSAKLGRVQWRRTGPTATDPGLLPETDPVHAIDTTLSLTDYITATPGNEYWYQADVYDNVGAGRLVAQLGTLHVEVP